ncbi:PQQ-dependent sugar dehydrogenase [Marinobacter bryozoorum]|uniref:PQQ-dependent sugar dehydrogenase n=1 Tax=Marinobacter bryozoorum TaxID=256324 RepID=UPI0020048CDB|nr:PQQ-dependent sugar dehydrogenase [Marinobacter bryozoorum]MCK7545517.1 PQQ-dependent sugar dehydrogenase [Marinobacter bryozoorum]
MSKRQTWSHIVLAFATALVIGAALGSIVQTQINLLALRGLGVEIGAGAWFATTLEDLAKFGPVYLVMFGVGFLLSQLVAMTLTRHKLHAWRRLVCSLAAVVGLWATFTLVDALAPPPTLIAATRSSGGMLAKLVTAAIAGWLFATMATESSGSNRKTGSATALLLIALLVAPSDQALAQSGPGYRLETVVSGLEHPWSLAFLPDGRMLVTERPGRLRIITADGELQPEPVAGVPEVFSEAQAGLFEVLPARNFPESGHIYLSYACGAAQANHTCLARGRLESGRLEDVDELFRASPAKVGAVHYGGRMAWLEDGTLLLTLGDGFDYREQAQRLDSHIGTIVRLNADGSAPEDNPFVDNPEALPEIFSYGHRNVQGLVVDKSSGQVFAHEHGPRGGDEINRIEGGKNYGWPVATHGLDYTWARVTPFTEYPGTEQPVLHWTPSIAPSGMTRYDGDQFPQWQGDLLVGGLVTRAAHRVEMDADGARERERLFEELGERIRDIRTGPDGAVYLLTDNADGRLVRVVPEPQ